MEFKAFPKIPRISRECIITEKIDGTNASVWIDEEGNIQAGSRNRFITPQQDNNGFAKWVEENKDELLKLGPGSHFGEWWGSGINRGYNLVKGNKIFSLFNTTRWGTAIRPRCCDIVPVLAGGIFTTELVESTLDYLRKNGSIASPGFMRPEGVVIYFPQANVLFKKTCERDEEHKGNPPEV